jgi:molecular chaperone HtpG
MIVIKENIINMEPELENSYLFESETITGLSSLCSRSPSEISKEQHEEFYKQFFVDIEVPLAYIHKYVEDSEVAYNVLFYIPASKTAEFYTYSDPQGVSLFVNDIFITNDADEIRKLIPSYLRFVRGAISSNSLPLNVMREYAHYKPVLDKIQSGAVKSILDLLDNLASSDFERYMNFWESFGLILKAGIVEKNKNRIAKLLRFSSTQGDSYSQSVSLDDYISRLKTNQDKIYYIVADSYEAAISSQYLSGFQDAGVEVLLMYRNGDEVIAATLTEYEGIPLQSILEVAQS